jgi:hypothetical protein
MPIVPAIIAVLSIAPIFIASTKGKVPRRLVIRGVGNAVINALLWSANHVTGNACVNSQKLCDPNFYGYWAYVFITIVNLVLVPTLWKEAYGRSTDTTQQTVVKVMGISAALFALVIIAIMMLAAILLAVA